MKQMNIALLIAGTVLVVAGVGAILIAFANERDDRLRAESQAVQFADAANDMLQWQVEQIKAKTFRLEIMSAKEPK